MVKVFHVIWTIIAAAQDLHQKEAGSGAGHQTQALRWE